MSCTEQAVISLMRTCRQKMRCCYPEQNLETYNRGPIGWILVGEDHDTRLLKEKLGPLTTAS